MIYGDTYCIMIIHAYTMHDINTNFLNWQAIFDFCTKYGLQLMMSELSYKVNLIKINLINKDTFLRFDYQNCDYIIQDPILASDFRVVLSLFCRDKFILLILFS